MKRFVKKAIAGTLSLAMVFSMGLVSDTQTASAKKVKVKKVSVTAPSGKTAYVAKGKKVKLTTTVKVTPNKKANKKVSFKSANSKIASVNSKGYVKGVKAGATKITVVSKKNSKKKATIKVVVKKAAVKSVKLSAKKASLAVGATKKLKATVKPTKNVSKKIAWSSSKKSVAKVSSKGVVKGVKEGTAKITAKAADGSGKKATCTVTVGVGIKGVEVLNAQIVRVTLTSAKALTAANFAVQKKSTPKGTYNTSEGIEKVNTTDGGKTYDVVLNNDGWISDNSYVKVTVNALSFDKSKEIYVAHVPDYEYGVTDTISRVTSSVKSSYNSSWYIDNNAAVGATKLSVAGLPAGLKAYVSKKGTSVRIVGKFTKVENGTTAVLTGVDETGKTFKKSYVFYVGDENTIVGNFLGDTILSYQADDPSTKLVNEEDGFNFGGKNITELGDGVLAGGSGNYTYAVTGLPAQVESVTVEGKLLQAEDTNDRNVAVPAGTYNVTVTATDKVNTNLKASFPFTLVITDGVVVSGTVKDASGAPAKNINVIGYTKSDAYNNYDSLSAKTKADGTYKTRVIPGTYMQYARFGYSDDTYDTSIDNVYTAAASVKDMTISAYRVNFTTTAAGATAYSPYSSIEVVDANGSFNYINVDTDDYTLYSYLPAGTYEFSPSADEDDNIVRAYAKTMTDTDGRKYTVSEDYLGKFNLSGTFTVAATANVALTATKIAEED